MDNTSIGRIRANLKYLCSDELQGRLSGSQGARLAASFLANELQQLGFEASGNDGFFEKVMVPAARLTGPVTLSIGKWNLLHRIEFGETAFYGGGECEGNLVVLTEETNYPESDLKGKIVLLQGVTNTLDIKSTVQEAKKIGIKAILMDGGEPRWFAKSVMGDYQTSDKNIPIIKIRTSLLPEVKELEGELVRLHLPISISAEACQNVMGFLPGKEQGKTIALVTHYDFLGDDPEGYRFEGAGDNAAGVATILEVARKLSNRKENLPFHFLIVFTTGEESNLWGEKHFIQHPPREINKSIYLDALGRTPYYSLNLIYEQSDEAFTDTFAHVLETSGIKVNRKQMQKHLFNLLITGTSRIKFRPYHTPDDSWKLIHIDVLEEVANALIESVVELGKNDFGHI